MSDNTPEMREKVYDKARGAIRRQLENIDPPVSEAVRHKQLAKLEEAIQEIEDANTETLPEIDEDAFADILSDGQIDEDDIGEEEEVEAAPVPKRRPPKPKPVLRPEMDDEDDDYDDIGVDDAVKPDARRMRETDVSDYLMPRKKRSAGPLVGAIAALVVIVALGVGLWMFGDRITALVFGPTDGIQSAGTVSTDQSSTSDDEQTGTGAGQTTGRPSETPVDTATDGTASNVTDGPQKHTQRLLTDGSEVDEGPGGAAALAVDAEGKSVASLDVTKPDTVAPVKAPQTSNDTAATSPSVPAAPVVGQKMFLYEERLGQQAPTAEQGTVLWSIVRESPGDNLPPEPAIEAQINIPEKGMSAIMTIKRNADQSLPASHLIEIVFALTEQFDGNGIGAIQNFAMKQTEQDTGDSLIAVPAKITDSFFMIALNDYVEAVDLNLKLLRERNWIDLPVAYGNGRRALLTMEKGSSGAEVFDQVIRAWEARTASSTQ
ncbi:MAG: hypothetical protein GY789_18345 [Hyphomicrobiales bacterium]|nr:hypothetical protein [Hyphomicrobiales bacterium]MCP5000949.1 hypothetical protein [Hyphomicrobiales bacterium]